MASINAARPDLQVKAQHSALKAVLTSRTFSKTPRLAALLEYLCARYFQGDTGSIKEYNIATDVFGRAADFDQASDAIVRVEMHRLRKKLKEFYLGEGAEQTLEIAIQSGHYLPQFVVRDKELEIVQPHDADLFSPHSEPASSGAPQTVQKSRVPVWLALLAVGLILAALVAVAVNSLQRKPHDDSASAAPVPDPPAPIAIRPGEGARLLCGSSKSGDRDRQGRQWGPDAFYSGGVASAVPVQPIWRTRDPFLFRNMRSGEFAYKIPLKSGVYEMRLYFGDTSYLPGSAMEGGENVRVFNLLINGTVALRNFDIIADSGPSTADVKVFKDVGPAKDGYLHLAFSKQTDTPLINAIEIVPGTPHRLRPVRIVTQDSSVTDQNGTTWYPDDYFLGGRTIARFGTINGPEDPEIFARERYGNFSYAIPVGYGRYGVTLRFAETFFGPSGPGGGGLGSRVFDVYCNGTALLRNFDMFQEVGSHRQLIKTYHGLQPNAQGKLLFSFIPHSNYANVSAIEVVDETEQGSRK
ncbi:MAG: malectin domain-containing carbohydrate-binding protein [Bryobacteraceae bacterium]